MMTLYGTELWIDKGDNDIGIFLGAIERIDPTGTEPEFYDVSNLSKKDWDEIEAYSEREKRTALHLRLRAEMVPVIEAIRDQGTVVPVFIALADPRGTEFHFEAQIDDFIGDHLTLVHRSGTEMRQTNPTG